MNINTVQLTVSFFLPIISMYRRISYCALLGMEGREERKEQAGKDMEGWKDGEREREEGKIERERT